MTDNSAFSLLQSARKTFLRGFLFAGFVSFFINLSMLVGPIFMIQVYNRVIPAKSYDSLYGLLVIALLGIVIYALLDFVRSWTYGVVSYGVSQQLNLPALQAGVLKSIGGGVGVGGTVIRDISELRSFIASNAVSTPLDAAWSVIFLIALYFVHPVYFAVAAGFIAAMLCLNLVTDLLTRPALREAQEAEHGHAQEVANSLRHAEAVEAMGMLPALVRGWRKSQAEMLDLSYTAMTRARVLLAISKALHKSLQMVTVATGAFLVLGGEVSPGVLFAGMILTAQAVSPFAGMVETWHSWVSAGHAWGRIKTLVREQGSARQSMPAPVGDGGLVVENLVYAPEGADVAVLRGISFALNAGEILGIAGPSGAGKSTLARCLTGIVRPSAGGAYLDGHSTYLWERSSFGRAVGYLPQSLAILDGTVRQVIARMQDSDPRDVIRAAQAAGIHDLIGRLPHGYDTPVVEGRHLLSGGQLQRLALARALYGEPKLLILDEPNSNLDQTGEHALVAAISAARERGAIVIMIAHRPSVMSVADKLLILEHGRVTQFGPRTEVVSAISGGSFRPQVIQGRQATESRDE
jgi:ATP-binding cassette subfamily C protein